MKNNINVFLISLIIFIVSGCSSNSNEKGAYSEGEIVKDIDGNEYNTIKIGDQIWMTENLKVTKYNNGDKINMPPKGSEYSLTGGPIEKDKAKDWYYNVWDTRDACINYNNDEKQRFNSFEDGPDSRGKYGLLYNCKSVIDPRGLAPKGYHIPSKEEFETLIKNLGGYEGTTFSDLLQSWDGAVGVKLRSEKDWQIDENHSSKGTNESGFNALPSGYKSGGMGDFGGIGDQTHFWTSTVSPEPLDENGEARYDNWHATISNHHVDGINLEFMGKGHGYSVRCIKDYPGMIVNKTIKKENENEHDTSYSHEENQQNNIVVEEINENNSAADSINKAKSLYKIQDKDGFSNLRLTINGSVLRKVYEAEKFEVLETEGDWSKVKLSDGTEGYIHSSRIVKIN